MYHPLFLPLPHFFLLLPFSTSLPNNFPGREEEEEKEEAMAMGLLDQSATDILQSGRKEKKGYVSAGISQCCIFNSAASHGHGWPSCSVWAIGSEGMEG